MRNGLRHLEWRNARTLGLRDTSAERLDAGAVQLDALGGHPRRRLLGAGAALLPDRGRHRSRLDRGDLDPERAQLLSKRIGYRLECELGGVVRPEERGRQATADRADVDNSPTGPAQCRQRRLGDGDLADEVDLQLSAPFVDRDELEGSAKGNAGVVDQSLEAFW